MVRRMSRGVSPYTPLSPAVADYCAKILAEDEVAEDSTLLVYEEVKPDMVDKLDPSLTLKAMV